MVCACTLAKQAPYVRTSAVIGKFASLRVSNPESVAGSRKSAAARRVLGNERLELCLLRGDLAPKQYLLQVHAARGATVEHAGFVAGLGYVALRLGLLGCTVLSPA